MVDTAHNTAWQQRGAAGDRDRYDGRTPAGKKQVLKEQGEGACHGGRGDTFCPTAQQIVRRGLCLVRSLALRRQGNSVTTQAACGQAIVKLRRTQPERSRWIRRSQPLPTKVNQSRPQQPQFSPPSSMPSFTPSEMRILTRSNVSKRLHAAATSPARMLTWVRPATMNESGRPFPVAAESWTLADVSTAPPVPHTT